jgi:hypothetical protein
MLVKMKEKNLLKIQPLPTVLRMQAIRSKQLSPAPAWRHWWQVAAGCRLMTIGGNPSSRRILDTIERGVFPWHSLCVAHTSCLVYPGKHDCIHFVSKEQSHSSDSKRNVVVTIQRLHERPHAILLSSFSSARPPVYLSPKLVLEYLLIPCTPKCPTSDPCQRAFLPTRRRGCNQVKPSQCDRCNQMAAQVLQLNIHRTLICIVTTGFFHIN